LHSEEATLPRLTVLGGGSWGTALALALCSRFASLRMWVRDTTLWAEMNRLHENRKYLPGFSLPHHLYATSDLPAALDNADFVLAAVPSQFLRNVIRQTRPHLPSHSVLVSATKGLEQGTLLRMSELLSGELAGVLASPITVLSGPTFAKEVAAGEPAALVVASSDTAAASAVQTAFATSKLRLYTSSDVVGTETGAALKNVIAIGAGICAGLGLGSNSVAALITRGLAEITRLAVAMGGNPRTLSGLAGLGDLVLTATGDLSRNRFVGFQLGQGHKLKQILAQMTMVAEGVDTCSAARQLGQKHGVDLPIITQMFEVLYREKDPREAIRELMERPLTAE